MKSLDAICAALQRTTSEAAGPCPKAAPKESSASRRKNSKPQLCRREPEAEPVQQQEQQQPDTELAIKEEDSDRGSLTELELGGPPPSLTSVGLPSAESAIAGANPSLEHYIRRFEGPDCGFGGCAVAGAREHFHCHRCAFRLFVKRDEMLRHYKWHRKREESLAHGFMRYSASDPCADAFGPCAHSLRQTHYHCLHRDCDKVYISTSDVQMHANSHRKAAHIAREGFQRFKASEECGFPDCPFNDGTHRTTHFHCLRSDCSHSFKNKSDMDKHKAHHLRDEALARDGFKKWLKSEACRFPRCPFSRALNHIHCIRPGCEYVLHSTSQMYSHKRKHEKSEKLGSVAGSGSREELLSSIAALASSAADARLRIKHYDPASQQFYSASNSPVPPTPDLPRLVDPPKLRIKHYDPITQGFTDDCPPTPPPADAKADEGRIDLGLFQQPFNIPIAPLEDAEPTPEASDAAQSASSAVEKNGAKWALDSWRKYITRYTANDPCVAHCTLMYKDHYHCTSGEGCLLTFRGKEGVREHARQHQLLDAAADRFRRVPADAPCPDCRLAAAAHFHCLDCRDVIAADEAVFRRLEHAKLHEYAADAADQTDKRGPRKSKAPAKALQEAVRIPQNEIVDANKRARGRTNQGFSSDFKGLIPGGIKAEVPVLEGFASFSSTTPCPDVRCKFARTRHFHCSAPRCYFAASAAVAAASHSTDFHGSLEIPDGFACFDKDVVCAFDAICPHSAKARHFHCLRPGCPEAFLKVNALSAHAHPADATADGLVKAAGTFFPNASAAAIAAALLSDLAAQTPSATPAAPAPYSVEQNCGRPFCKLKRRVHYHCAACSQGFSNASRLLPHLQKHGLTLPPAAAGAALMGNLPSLVSTATSLMASSPSLAATATHQSTSTTSAASLLSPAINASASLPAVSFAQSIEQLKSSIVASTMGGVASSSSGQKIKFHAFQPQLLKYTTDGKRLFEESASLPDSSFPALFPPADGQRKKSSGKRKAAEDPAGGAKKFKFVDCTQDALDAVMAANRTEDVAPDGFARFGSRSDCGVLGCALNGCLHYHCLHPPCAGLALPDKSLAPAHIRSHVEL